MKAMRRLFLGASRSVCSLAESLLPRTATFRNERGLKGANPEGSMKSEDEKEEYKKPKPWNVQAR